MFAESGSFCCNSVSRRTFRCLANRPHCGIVDSPQAALQNLRPPSLKPAEATSAACGWGARELRAHGADDGCACDSACTTERSATSLIARFLSLLSSAATSVFLPLPRVVRVSEAGASSRWALPAPLSLSSLPLRPCIVRPLALWRITTCWVRLVKEPMVSS